MKIVKVFSKRQKCISKPNQLFAKGVCFTNYKKYLAFLQNYKEKTPISRNFCFCDVGDQIAENCREAENFLKLFEIFEKSSFKFRMHAIFRLKTFEKCELSQLLLFLISPILRFFVFWIRIEWNVVFRNGSRRWTSNSTQTR